MRVAFFGGLFLWVLIVSSLSGCMQAFGAKHIDAWGLKIDSNAGFEVSAGAMQFDGADNRKSMNGGAKDGRY